MYNSKKRYLSLLTICSMLLVMNCRAPVKPTEEDLADYGWVIYEEGDYEEAREWFKDALKKDPIYADGYNGMGWCFGKLHQADSAVHYFTIADSLEYDPLITPDSLVREYAGFFFGNQNVAEEGNWAFSHDPKINHMDVLIIRALAEFTMGYFQLSIESLEAIYRDMGVPKDVDADYNTVVGRSELAAELEYVQSVLKNQ